MIWLVLSAVITAFLSERICAVVNALICVLDKESSWPLASAPVCEVFSALSCVVLIDAICRREKA